MFSKVINNPYRVLGIYCNSPAKDIINNKNRISAFLRVGKQCSFPSDMTSIVENLERTQESIEIANQQLNLDRDKVTNAFFWFFQDSPLDTAALSNLQKGNIDKAKEILEKKDTFSSLINRAVIGYLENNTIYSIKQMSCLLSDKELIISFIESVCGKMHNISTNDLSRLYIDALACEIGWIDLYRMFQIEWKQVSDLDYIRSNLIKAPSERIKQILEKYSQEDNNNKLLEACETIMQLTQPDLKIIDDFLEEDNAQRIICHDKIANTICAISMKFFHAYQESISDENANLQQEDLNTVYSKIQNLLYRAQNIAAGTIAKNNIDKNLELFKNEKDSKIVLPILVKITVFHTLQNVSCELIDSFINETSLDISQVKAKYHVDDKIIVMVSDMVVTLSLNALIGIANKAQESPEIIKNGIITGNLKSTLTSVLSCLDKLNNFTVSQDISNRLEKNRNTISQSLEQLNQIIYQMKQKNEGCYIATMVYGDYEHPKVKILRHFRDHVLSRFEIGRKFITFYYKNSPSWVVKSHNKILLNFIIREILNIFVWFYKNVKK